MGQIEPAKKICFVIGPMSGPAEMERQQRLATILREAFEKLEHGDFEVSTPVIAGSGDIVQQVLRELDRADIVVADLTGNNPSVFYELAVRHSMGLPCVHVRDKSTAKDIPLAFDVRQYRYVDVDLSPNASDHGDLIEMLGSALQEAGDSLKSAGNPVTTYFKTPLTDVYPASGLAMGYWYNFVERTAEGIVAVAAEKLPIKIKVPDEAKAADAAQAAKWRESSTLTDEEWQEIKWREDLLELTDEEWAAITLAIWIPDKRDFVLPRYIDVLKRTGKFWDATLHDPKRKFRDIPVLFRRDPPQVIDIPTTLRAIANSVDDHLGLASAVGQKQLKREFDRFTRSLAYWQRNSVESDKRNDRVGERTKFVEKKVVIAELPQEYR